MGAAGGPPLKATLRFGAPVESSSEGISALGATLQGGVAPPVSAVDLGDTVDAPASASGAGAGGQAAMTATTGGRSTVLPRRRTQGAAIAEERPRFERVRLLGEGGMGLVELARDNDIRRTVAVKRLHADARSEEALLRFADEVRIIGQLEHPSIVPVYDVGRDDSGEVYLVMKHLSGETMEQIIEKLRAGDPACTAQYSIDFRVHVFLGVLDAMRYAHARGVIHRDIKPANIMIGPYGEVTVLDWGIAKPIHRKAAEGGAQPLERTLVDTHDKRLQETQLGSLAGTPLYMSPEQAAGRNDELDERSDLYSLCVVLYEWLSLEHPLKDKKTVTEVLAAIISGEPSVRTLGGRALQAGVPAELVHVMMDGLARGRDQRLKSVAELEGALKSVLDGRVAVRCHVTLTKRTLYEVIAWIDAHPGVYTILFTLVALSLLAALGLGGYRLVHPLR
jgi:serine/threonine protein kinase